MFLVNRFLRDAEHIFEVASQSHEPEDLTIQLSPEGGIHISAGPDYSCFPSNTMYRVRRVEGRVEVEGRSGARTCFLRTEVGPPSWLVDRPAYACST